MLGTENPSDLMTKHVDAKLLGEHVRSMGCEFTDGRAELAPQVVQDVEDSNDDHIDDTINLCEDDGEIASEGCTTTDEDDGEVASEGCTAIDAPSELMIASVRSNRSTAHQNPLRNRHRTVCTIGSAGPIVSSKLSGRRQGMGKCAQSPRDDQLYRQSLPRDKIGRAPARASESEIPCTGPDEHLRGHPCRFFLPQRQSQSRGSACLCICPCRRLIDYAYTDFDLHDASTGEHSRTYDVCTSAFSLDAFWAQA